MDHDGSLDNIWIISEFVSGWSNWSSAGRSTGAAFGLAVVTIF
jgi:hypothetical protein